MTVTIQEETYEQCAEDMKILAKECWEEVGHGGTARRVPDINTPAYRALAEKGAVIALTVRDDADLIGYCTVFLTNLLQHQGVKQAFCDSIFIKKERRGILGLILLQAVRKAAREHGAENIDFTVTNAVDFGKVLEAMGGVLTSWTYSMELKDA